MRDDDKLRMANERMALLLSHWGFPRMAARILMAVTCADKEALTATEIGEVLDVSPAAVSGGVRYLTQIGFLIKEPVLGSRRDSYRLTDDPWWEVSTLKIDAYRMIGTIADDTLAGVDDDSLAAGRLHTMREYFRFVEERVPELLAEWKVYKAENGLT